LTARHKVVRNHKLKLSGRMAPAPTYREFVAIEQRRGHRPWRRIAWARVATDGRYGYTVRLRKSGPVRFRAQIADLGVTSDTVRVRVRR
jgi:hypothetical protein